jgi:capsular polysaccharide biosynthesis protein
VKTLLVGAIVASLLAAAVVTVASLLQTPKYEASALVMVDLQKPSGRQTYPTGSVIQTVVTAIDSHPVAEGAIRRLGFRACPDELLNNLTARQLQASRFIRLTYTDTDAERARQVANTVGRVSSERISNTGATATLYEKAIAYYAPASPKPLRNGLLALVAGPVLSAALVAGRRVLGR